MNIIDLAKQAGLGESYISKTRKESGIVIKNIDCLEAFAALVAAHERESIAQMFESAPLLVQFAQNDQGGCFVCGFTPKLVIKVIRARGTT